MPHPDKLFLLGLPGSGKSTLGKELAKLMGLLFVDLDLEIERKTRKSIKDIFAEEGEAHFREVESLVLKNWCEKGSGFVMATGGGTPCFHNNMKTIQNAGASVFLDVPPAEIVTRMEDAARAERPLLSHGEPALLPRLTQLLSERVDFYRKATITVSGAELNAEAIRMEIQLLP